MKFGGSNAVYLLVLGKNKQLSVVSIISVLSFPVKGFGFDPVKGQMWVLLAPP